MNVVGVVTSALEQWVPSEGEDGQQDLENHKDGKPDFSLIYTLLIL